MDWPDNNPKPLFLNTWSRYMAGYDIRTNGALGSPAAITWTASLATYVPMTLPWPYQVQRWFWINGSTTTSTTVQMAIYTMDGTKIQETGRTVQGTASTIQYVSASTPFVLSAGRYMLGWWCNNTTSRGYGSNAVSVIYSRACGIVQETSLANFGSTATFAQQTVAAIPLCGITTTVTGWL